MGLNSLQWGYSSVVSTVAFATVPAAAAIAAAMFGSSAAAFCAAQRPGLHVEGSGANAGRLRHRVDGDVDAAATDTGRREPDSNDRSRSCERLFQVLPIGDGGMNGGAAYRFRSETAMLAWSGSIAFRGAGPGSSV
jgi:hypothetical protein